RVKALVAEHGVEPGLAVALVGDDPASRVYVNSKSKATLAVGMRSLEWKLPADEPEAKLIDLVKRLNAADSVGGILVRLPRPAHIDPGKVVDTIYPNKDVDGLHVVNAGRLAQGQPGLVSCTPAGCMMLIRDHLGDVTGAHAVVVGRSNLVGKPM